MSSLRALLVVGLFGAAVGVSACFNFDGALEDCKDAGRCYPEDGGHLDADAGEPPVTPDGSTTPDASTLVEDAGPDAGAPGLCYPLSDAGGRRVCTESPFPFGEGLTDVWVSPAGSVWMVGHSGAVIQHVDGGWFRHSVPFTEDTPGYASDQTWHGVWGVGEDDLYVVGQAGRIVHYRSGAWTSEGGAAIAGDLFDVHCRGKDCWTASSPDKIHFSLDGGAWQTQSALGTTTPAAAVWASDSGSVWVAASTTVYQGPGSWTPREPNSTPQARTEIYGANDGRIWVAGIGQGGLQKWDGVGWTFEATLNAATIHALHGIDDVIWACTETGAVLQRPPMSVGAWTTPEVISPSASLRSIFSSPTAGVWTVGDNGAIHHRSDAGWRQVSSGSRPVRLRDVSSTDVTNAFAVGGTEVLRRDGPSSWVNISPSTNVTWHGVHTFGPNDTWVVGVYGAIRHYDGAKWTPYDQSSLATEDLFGVWGASPSDVWAVGRSGTILHWNGSQWSRVPSGTTLNLERVHGNGANDVWVVGDQGIILRGPNWKQVTAPPAHATTPFNDVFVGTDEVWLSAGQLVYRHEPNQTWTLVHENVYLTGFSIIALSKDEVWTTGNQGTIWKFDRASDSFIRHAIGTRHTIYDLAGTSGGGFFAVGDEGAVRLIRR